MTVICACTRGGGGPPLAVAVAVVATLVPALRITQVDPAETLREG